MAFADPEELEALIAGIEAAHAPLQGNPDKAGSMARGTPVIRAFYTWLASEAARGTLPEDMCTAGAQLAGCFTAALVRANAMPGCERIVVEQMLNVIERRCEIMMAAPSAHHITIHEGSVQ